MITVTDTMEMNNRKIRLMISKQLHTCDLDRELQQLYESAFPVEEKVLVLAGKAKPKFISEDMLCDLLKGE